MRAPRHSEDPGSSKPSIPKAATIAGSDSGGCSGIQADLKTFAALGVHGMSVLTSVTAQNTQRLYTSSDVPLTNIALQMDAVIGDIGVDAAKTGMLSSAAIVSLVAGKLRDLEVFSLVVDPVMATTGGDSLLDTDALESLRSELLPLALVVTPNIEEAEILAGSGITTERELRKTAERILSMGPRYVLIKGGHRKTDRESIDCLFDGEEWIELKAPRIRTESSRGSGCTLAAAITAFLSRGYSVERAVREAKEYVTQALRHPLRIGEGPGPLGHFWKWWPNN